MQKGKKRRDPQRKQKQFAAVLAVVLCLSLVLSLVAGVLAY